jgi:hypothetical protein
MAAIPVGPVVYSCKINGVLKKDLPMDFELHQYWSRHDLFIIRMGATPNHPYKHLLTAYPDNSPVEIQWGRLPDKVVTWYGYINHHEQSSEADGDLPAMQIKYFCIGTSKTMNTDKTRVWSNTTPSGIAQKIAREQKLRCVVTTINWDLPYEVQAGESDFVFMSRMATKVGFKFWVSGGTMYFIDPAVVLSGASNSFLPEYHISKVPSQRDTAQHFRKLQGDNIPGGEIVNRQIYGMDYSTGQVFKAQADSASVSPVDFNETHRHVTSYAEAKRLMNAKQSLSQYWIYATCQVFGWPLLYPGKALKLGGYHMADDTKGNWIVTGAKHRMALSWMTPVLDVYVTEVELMRNVTGYTPNIKGIQKVTPEIVACTLSNGVWQSTNMNVVLEGSV